MAVNFELVGSPLIIKLAGVTVETGLSPLFSESIGVTDCSYKND